MSSSPKTPMQALMDEAARELNRACYEGRVEDALAWIAAGADPDAQGLSGKRALHFAAMAGHASLCQALALAREGAADARDQGGMTPLHLACGNNRVEAAKMLIDCGADADALDDFGRTPLDCCRFLDARRLLENAWLDRQAARRAAQALTASVGAARFGGPP